MKSKVKSKLYLKTYDSVTKRIKEIDNDFFNDEYYLDNINEVTKIKDKKRIKQIINSNDFHNRDYLIINSKTLNFLLINDMLEKKTLNKIIYDFDMKNKTLIDNFYFLPEENRIDVLHKFELNDKIVKVELEKEMKKESKIVILKRIDSFSIPINILNQIWDVSNLYAKSNIIRNKKIKFDKKFMKNKYQDFFEKDSIGKQSLIEVLMKKDKKYGNLFLKDWKRLDDNSKYEILRTQELDLKFFEDKITSFTNLEWSYIITNKNFNFYDEIIEKNWEVLKKEVKILIINDVKINKKNAEELYFKLDDNIKYNVIKNKNLSEEFIIKNWKKFKEREKEIFTLNNDFGENFIKNIFDSYSKNNVLSINYSMVENIIIKNKLSLEMIKEYEKMLKPYMSKVAKHQDLDKSFIIKNFKNFKPDVRENILKRNKLDKKYIIKEWSQFSQSEKILIIMKYDLPEKILIKDFKNFISLRSYILKFQTLSEEFLNNDIIKTDAQLIFIALQNQKNINNLLINNKNKFNVTINIVKNIIKNKIYTYEGILKFFDIQYDTKNYILKSMVLEIYKSKISNELIKEIKRLKNKSMLRKVRLNENNIISEEIVF